MKKEEHQIVNHNYNKEGQDAQRTYTTKTKQHTEKKMKTV